jgi:hypothetical protein
MFPIDWILQWSAFYQSPYPQYLIFQQEALTPLEGKKERLWNKQKAEILYIKAKALSEFLQKPLSDLTECEMIHIAEELKRTPTECLAKLKSILASGTLRAGKWSPEEDALLKEFVQESIRWGLISTRLNQMLHKGARVRTGKQCRERWNNHLNPNINKGPWTHEEDLKLLKLIRENGKKWTIVTQFFPERTENSLKNRLKSLLTEETQRVSNLGESFNFDNIIDDIVGKLTNHNSPLLQ